MKGKGSGKMQSGGHGTKHPQPERGTRKVGAATVGTARRDGNTSKPPSKSGSSVVHRGKMASRTGTQPSGGKTHPAVKYGDRGGYGY